MNISSDLEEAMTEVRQKLVLLQIKSSVLEKYYNLHITKQNEKHPYSHKISIRCFFLCIKYFHIEDLQYKFLYRDYIILDVCI